MISESIYDDGQYVIPMADVQYIRGREGVDGILVYLSGDMPILIENGDSFLSAWCYYRRELEEGRGDVFAGEPKDSRSNEVYIYSPDDQPSFDGPSIDVDKLVDRLKRILGDPKNFPYDAEFRYQCGRMRNNLHAVLRKIGEE